MAGAAAGAENSGAGQRCARDHDARPHAGAGADAVRLLAQHGDDLEVAAAKAEGLPYVCIQADEEFVCDHRRIALERLLKAHVGLEMGFSVVGIVGRIDRLQRNEQRHRIGRHRRHRKRLSDPGGAAAGNLLLDRANLFVVVGVGDMEDARAQVAGDQRTRFRRQRAAKTLAESANSNQRSHTDRNRKNHERELAGCGLEVAPADGCGALPAQGTIVA